ncbi:MAG: dienelactone hydrolase family protein [Paracoccaceae bacterium]
MDILCCTSRPIGRVLVIHSWWGLTRSFHDYAAQLAAEGFTVGSSDLFGGQTASDIEGARRLRRLPRRIPMYKSLIADIETLLAFEAPAPREVAIVGFSMGGHWAVWLSQQPGLPIRSTVLYYAARGGNFAASTSSYLAHFAQNDPWVSASARRGMERALTRAGRSYAAHDYPGTGHWLAEADRSQDYDAEAAALALQRTVSHLRG